MDELKPLTAVAVASRIRRLGSLSLLAFMLACAGRAVVAADTAAGQASPAAIIEHRQQALAYVAGLQAYFYGYPVVDYLRVMRDQITPDRDPGGVYAPVNQIAFQNQLAEPGGLYAGRGPNTSTLYFTAWMDLSDEPVLIETPDTDGRYYVLTYADLYSEVQHSGRRTTGTGAQRILVVGPGWQGEAPEGVQVVPMRTHYAYLLGRVLVDGPDDLAAARQVMHRFRMTGAQRAPADFALPERDALTSLAFFEELNQFLRDNPRISGEELLMTQLDQVGIGPSAEFSAQNLPAGIRSGLERAIADGYRILADSPRAAPPVTGWSTPSQETYGVYGHDYLRRAMVEFHGFLGNRAEETIYLSALTDAEGESLVGSNRYEIVFPASGLPPANAFWALNVYDARTVDLIPNAQRRYAISDRLADLKRRADGSVAVLLQQTRPDADDVNWLPVNDGPLFVTLRFFEPAAEVLAGDYSPPAIRRLP
jgi:hypothetical protein